MSIRTTELKRVGMCVLRNSCMIVHLLEMCVYFSRNNVALMKSYSLYISHCQRTFLYHFFQPFQNGDKGFNFDFDLGKIYHIQRIKRVRQDISKVVVDFRGLIY